MSDAVRQMPRVFRLIAPRRNIGQLALALAKAQGEMASASKDASNPHFGSRYATLASVWEAARKPLADHGLAVVQMPTADTNKVSVRTVLIHESGESIETVIEALARDASPQAIGSVITYLRRYGLAAMVGVAPDDDDDGNAGQADNPTHRQSRQAQRPAQRQQPAAARPTQAGPEPATNPQKAKIALEWVRIWGEGVNTAGSEQQVAARQHLEARTGKASRKDLTKDEATGYIDELVNLEPLPF